MSKHLLMLFAAVASLAAAPAIAAPTCTGASPNLTGTTVTTGLTAPIDTCTDGDIQINSPNGSVKISKANTAAVTINSANKVVNGGTISNKNANGARGVLLNGGLSDGGTGYTFAGNIFTNQGTIDLTGSGSSKDGVLLTNGTFTSNILLAGGTSIIKVNGDNSAGVKIDSTGILDGELNLGGLIAMTPTHPNSISSSNGLTDVTIAGIVNGNVTFDSTSVFSAIGENAQGVVITGSINCAKDSSNLCVSGGDLGTLKNSGNVSLVGKRLGRGQTGNSSTPESGSALLVEGNVGGGIINTGPISTSDSTPTGVLSSSGLEVNGAVAAVVQIFAPATGSIMIGQDTNDTDSGSASFINRGTIIAEPLSSNNTVAVYITGVSSTVTTTLMGNFFNAGTISAITTSTGGLNPSATAIIIGHHQATPVIDTIVPAIVISGESGRGTVNANVSGQGGGIANGIDIESSANVPEIDITGSGRIVATAGTTNPGSVSVLKAVGILDVGDTLKKINVAGLIDVAVTPLTNPNATQNFARAIDLSAQTTGGVTINNAGTIIGDVFLNGNGSTQSVLNIGAGTATGASAAQMTAASDAQTATGKQNLSNDTASEVGDVVFGGTGGSSTGVYALYINDYGSLAGTILNQGTLDIGVAQHGSLNVENATAALQVRNFDIYGGSPGGGANLTITASEDLRNPNICFSACATIISSGEATIASGTNFSVAIGSMVPQGTNDYVLIKAPANSLSVPDFATYATGISQHLPFFFNPTSSFLVCEDSLGNSSDCVTTGSELILQLTPKVPGPGTLAEPGLNLKGTAFTMFNPAVKALVNDTPLGAAIVNGIQDPSSHTVNTPEQVFSQFAPDVSGDVRDIAITLTDEASGPVAARQRQLRMYANQPGDFTLWGQEFAEYFSNKGNNSGEISNFKDHGFGFSVGADGGDPAAGWYGGAFTFYSGDATQVSPENSKTQTEWYMLTGYTDWRGHHLFLDTQGSVGLGNFRGQRFLKLADVGNQIFSCGAQGVACSREADSKRSGLLGALGATTGAQFNFGQFVVMPEIALDGLTMREEGYTESGGGKGFNLRVDPYYATSLRTFLGADSRVDVDLGDFTLQPEARLGYRFDFINDPVKIRGAFVSAPADTFTVTGPDPSRGNVVAGATIGASTDTWSLGANFDWVRGSNGSTTEVGTFNLLGRI